MVKKIIALIVFIIAIVLVVKGKDVAGTNGLLIMMSGLAIILSEIGLYNRQYN